MAYSGFKQLTDAVYNEISAVSDNHSSPASILSGNMYDRIRLWRYFDQSAEKKYARRIAIMKVTILWPVRPCDVAQRCRGFEGNGCVNLKDIRDILANCPESYPRTVICAVTTVKTLNVTSGIYFFLTKELPAAASAHRLQGCHHHRTFENNSSKYVNKIFIVVP
jgi:hypothetical protein